MQKVFENGNEIDSRKIIIKIEGGYINFYYQKHGTEGDPFYWIGLNEWIKDNNSLHNHMMRKAWFTSEMKDFMDTANK